MMGSVLSHTEIQIIGLAASKSVEKPGALSGLISSCKMCLVAWISAVSPFTHFFYSLNWAGEVLSFGLCFQDCFIVSSQKLRNGEAEADTLLSFPVSQIPLSSHCRTGLFHFPLLAPLLPYFFFFPVSLKIWLFR